MNQNLKNLSLATMAASFWAKHKFETWSQVISGAEYKSATKEFCRQVDALELPETLKSDLKLVIIDFGKKKKFWTRSCLSDGKSLEYANVVHWNGLGMVDVDRVEDEWEEMRGTLPEFSADCRRMHERPRPIYIQVHPDSHPLLEFGRLTPKDGSGLVYYWETCEEEYHGFFISLMDKDKFDNPNDLRLSPPAGPGKSASRSELFCFDHPNRNSEVARFVFEVLNQEQREQIFNIGESDLITEDDSFRGFFVNLFCHWPWQEEAFKYFTSKTEISEAQCVVLRDIMEYKKAQEMNLLPSHRSFYERVERFHNTVCRRCKLQ